MIDDCQLSIGKGNKLAEEIKKAAVATMIEVNLVGRWETEIVPSTGELIEQINGLNPPNKVMEKDVHIRAARLAGDAVDNQGGRFRTADMPLLLQLTNGAPVLIGHQKDTLAIGKFFGGKLEKVSKSESKESQDAVAPGLQTEEITYIKPNLYWMREASFAKDLAVNIDGGIYRELSLGFLFKTPTCSICDKDIRRCEHIPGDEYEGKLCWFWYDGIYRVLEGSIVYRGAQGGTGFDKLEGILSLKVDKLASLQVDKVESLQGEGNLTTKKPPLSPPATAVGGETLENISVEDKKKEGQEKMEAIKLEFLPEVLGALARTLGVEKVADANELINGAVELRAKFDGQAAQIKTLETDARFGKNLRDSQRADLKKIETQIASFSQGSPREHILLAIDQTSDLEALTKIEISLQAELDKLAPPLKCANCGGTEFTRRQSEPELRLEEQPVRRRVVDPVGVRI